ncbi:MAG: glycoside hydrolase family 25 protein [Phyllobacterium sp.]|uniref:glycoside hydrolase family 25 protein n=1 Tax=Phyllobacterium sp. TaxID=1871046 RepID=UPI0030F0B5B1
MNLNAVIDISHHNGTRLRFDKARDDGIAGVIQKATQGEGYVDRTFARNRTAALDSGLLFGAYHFGTGANGISQAEHFLRTVDPDENTVVVLDFEDNPTGSSMTLEEARSFVTHIHAVLGRWPGLYSGHTIKRALGSTVDRTLRNCWFWLAQYGPTPVVPATWDTYKLWQYTDGGVGPEPHKVDGIGTCDREFFQGNMNELRTWWGH